VILKGTSENGLSSKGDDQGKAAEVLASEEAKKNPKMITILQLVSVIAY
jgi:hypothetical protein